MSDENFIPEALPVADVAEPQDELSQMTDSELEAVLVEATPNAVDNQAIQNDIKDYKKYGDSAFRTAAESAADAATFGLSSQFQTKVLGVDPEDIRKRAEFNPVSNVLGQATGVIAPLVASGGTSAAAKGISSAGKAVIAAEKANAKISEALIKKVIANSGNKNIAKELVKKSLAKGTGSAVEGAAYGTGQLIREDALGTADFNAQNLLAYTGSGALLGGTLGSVLPLGSAAADKIGATLSKNTGKLFKKVTDPVVDSAKLLGYTPAQVHKISTKNPKFFEEMPAFLRDRLNLKLVDNTDELLKKTYNLEKAAIKEMDHVYDQVENIAIDKTSLFRTFSKLEDEFIKPYEGMASFKTAIGPVKRIVADLRAMGQKPGMLTAKDLRSMRIKMDELGKAYYKSLDPTKGAEAAFRARTILRDEINDVITSINPALGARLKTANKDFHYATEIKKSLEKKTLKDKDLIDFKDYVYGGILGAGFGPEALLIPAAKKLMESDLKRRVVVLSAIEKSNKLVEKKLSESAKNFISSSKKAINPLSVKALMNSPLAYKDKKEPKNKQEAYKNISEKVVEMTTSPEKFAEKMSKSLYNIAQAAPETADAILQNSQKTLEFLNSKMPKNSNPLSGPKFMVREYTPSSMEMSKFERYIQVLDNPMSALDELEAGTLTREHVEVLKEVYPNLYTRIQQEVSNKVADETKMDYNKKVQLGILLDITTDPSLISENLMALQANFAVQPEVDNNGSVPQTATGAAKLDMASRSETPTEQNLRRNT